MMSDDVISGVEELVENDTIPDEFVSYFEYTYIGISRGRGVNKKRSSPLFPVSIWNMHSKVCDASQRTNNG